MIVEATKIVMNRILGFFLLEVCLSLTKIPSNFVGDPDRDLDPGNV